MKQQNGSYSGKIYIDGSVFVLELLLYVYLCKISKHIQ